MPMIPSYAQCVNCGQVTGVLTYSKEWIAREKKNWPQVADGVGPKPGDKAGRQGEITHVLVR